MSNSRKLAFAGVVAYSAITRWLVLSGIIPAGLFILMSGSVVLVGWISFSIYRVLR